MIKDTLKALVERYQEAKDKGQLKNSSEATMRTWIDELLSVFGWDVQNTQQVLTEQILGKVEKKKLHEIGSTNTRPDYTLVNGNVMLAFVDAKSLDVNIENDKDVAFQIRSYGWSIGAAFSVVTNFEQLAIYDCSVMPKNTDGADFARREFLTVDTYIENFELLDSFLSRTNVLAGNVKYVAKKGNTLDEKFSKMLGEVRKNLAKAILDSNNIDSIATLSYHVQTIINRILFIRVCESRGLEEDGLLHQYAETDFWAEFKNSSYAKFYERYDGPMFKRIQPLQSLTINNKALVDFVHDLYYPSPYRFDVIPLKTLSDIYDLFLGYQLVVKDGKVSDELKSEFKKSNGAVTTPEALVQQVIKSTMPDTLMNNLSIQEILSLKLADIACGSGVFLVGAYDYVVDFIEKKIAAGEEIDKSYYVVIDGKVTLTLEGRKALINNCIFGVDINPEAVEVTKLSLSLRIVDKYQPKDFGTVGLLGSQILNGIGANIKCGNSLVGADIETVCPEISQNIEELHATNAFDWKGSFPEVFANGGFDFILGNPPYVEVKNYNVGLPCMAAYIKKVYASGKNGKTDLAMPFIEQGIKLLNATGRLGFIVQKRFFKSDYGKGLRQLLTNSDDFILNGIYDYQETDLFGGKTTYVAILVCDKNSLNNTHVWYMNSLVQDSGKILPAQLFTDTPWNMESLPLNNLRLKLSGELGTLGDLCDIKVGLQVLWNDVFQIKGSQTDGLIHGTSKREKNIVIEAGACRPLLCNEKFFPLTKREYTQFGIFPYSISDGGKIREVPFSEFCNLYPMAGAYLERHKEELCKNNQTLPQIDKAKHKKNPHDENEFWHLYTRANHIGDRHPKICIPMTTIFTQSSVVLDMDIYCDNANMFYIMFEDCDEVKLYALSAIINSTIFNTLASSIANPQRGGYHKFNKQFLDPVPVPVQAFKKRTKNIVKLAEIAKRIEQTNEQIRQNSGMQTSGLELSLKSLWQQLDDLCNKLYGIKKPEEKALLYAVTRKDRNPYGQED